jgi:excinuclease ABC subunit C
MATLNARDALRRHLNEQAGLRDRFQALTDALSLESPPERIECFDISHTQGEATVASCVAFGPEGAIKSGYRHYNITAVTPGDDYAAIAQAVRRRYVHAAEDLQDSILPDLILIDGGKGQVASALGALAELGLDYLRLVGIAKGPDRRPGEEVLILPGEKKELHLDPDSPALHLIQQIRDEAHRFAITGHRGRRAKARTASTLEEIPGIGAHRRQALLKHLGGLQEVSRASADEIAKVPGISAQLAKRIYENFHDGTGGT